MKGPCTLVASALAASTVALASSSSTPCQRDHASNPSSPQGWISSSSLSSSSSVQSDITGPCTSSSNKERFVPRFDGLRFIETLVTAHR